MFMHFTVDNMVLSADRKTNIMNALIFTSVYIHVYKLYSFNTLCGLNNCIQ